jgi:hypothetical protein
MRASASFPRLAPPLLVASLALAAVAAACSATNKATEPADTSGAGAGGSGTGTASGKGGAGGDASAQAIAITPADATLGVGGNAPPTLAYKASFQPKGAAAVDVTGEATWSVDDATLGSFAGATFAASGKPGKTTVHASARGASGSTSLSIKVASVIIAPGAPADAPTKFGGADDPSKKPTLVYPPDGVLVPPNMTELEVQFTPAAGTSLYWARFDAPMALVDVYFTCTQVGGGCGYTPDATVWKLVAEGGRGADPVKLTVAATDGNGGFGTSASQTISFGQEDIVGGLYYWNAAAGATVRYEFGKSGQQAETYLNAASVGASQCVGCHVLSRDGKRIAVGMDIPSPSPYKVLDVATKKPFYGLGSMFGGGGANFFSFSPDGTQILTSNAVTIELHDATTGAAIAAPLVATGAMPDWSPDGKTIVYSKPQQPPPCFGQICGAPGVDQASLETMKFDGKAWAPGPSLVPFAGQNDYYASFAPDGQWVLFNRAAGNSYDAKDATVWFVPSAGGTPVALATASTGGDSWPKWAPDVQAYRGKSLLWLTFSSRRAYGLRKAQGDPAQIWMTAFDPTRAGEGKDPSYPAFWLPFQDLASGNHIAQWVTKVVRKPCLQQGDCEATELCENGICEPAPPK